VFDVSIYIKASIKALILSQNLNIFKGRNKKHYDHTKRTKLTVVKSAYLWQ